MNNHTASWISGFIDGEGCFTIHASVRRGDEVIVWRPRIQIGLRYDDIDALKLIQSHFGGKIYKDTLKGCHAPRALLEISKNRDLMSLVAHFRKYPLLAKKRRDFELWAQAVEHKAKYRGNPNNTYLAALATALSSIKSYGAVEEAIELIKKNQLELNI